MNKTIIVWCKNPNARVKLTLNTCLQSKNHIYFGVISEDVREELIKDLKECNSEYTVWLEESNGLAGLKIVSSRGPTIEDIVHY